MKNKKPLLLGGLVLLALYILVSLGNWQVRRLAWKMVLIDTLENASSLKPVPYKNWLGQQKQYSGVGSNFYYKFEEFERVTLSGRFSHEQEAYVYSFQNGKTGHMVFVPFRLQKPARGLNFIMVNRGFVPGPIGGAALRKIDRPTGMVHLKGFTRAIEPGTFFTPQPDLQKRQWFSQDATGMAQHFGYFPGDPPNLYIEVEAVAKSKVWPRGKNPQQLAKSIPNNHLGYIITWYGLALALLGVYGFFLYGQLKKTTAGKPPEDKKPEGQAPKGQAEKDEQ